MAVTCKVLGQLVICMCSQSQGHIIQLRDVKLLSLLPNSSIENVDTRIDRCVKALVELKWFSILRYKNNKTGFEFKKIELIEVLFHLHIYYE